MVNNTRFSNRGSCRDLFILEKKNSFPQITRHTNYQRHSDRDSDMNYLVTHSQRKIQYASRLEDVYGNFAFNTFINPNGSVYHSDPNGTCDSNLEQRTIGSWHIYTILIVRNRGDPRKKKINLCLRLELK